jgi:membrane protease YdiL (CAAX protease family)
MLPALVYTIAVWLAPSIFWHFKRAWFKRMIKRFRYFLSAFNSSIFTLYVIVPLLLTWVVERKDLSSMGFFLPSFHTILVFTLVPYIVLFILFLIEYWYKVMLQRQSIDSALPIPKNYLREFLDQVFCVAFPEEVLIRGYLLPHLIELLNPTIAITISAMIFGLSPGHLLGGKLKVLRTFVDAVVLGVTFIYAGLFPCIILHFLGNLFDPRVARAILLKYSGFSTPGIHSPS